MLLLLILVVVQSRRFRRGVAHVRHTFREKQLERAMARHQLVVTGSLGERIMRFRISHRASFLSGTLTSSADSDVFWWDGQLSHVDRRVCRACADPLGSTAHAVVASTTHWPERRGRTLPGGAVFASTPVLHRRTVHLDRRLLRVGRKCTVERRQEGVCRMTLHIFCVSCSRLRLVAATCSGDDNMFIPLWL